MNKVIIFGGTGFIGSTLVKHLQNKGFLPIVVGRTEPTDSTQVTFRKWDAVNVGDWAEELENCHAIVNLAGKTVDCVKTPDNCDLILRSRVDSTKTIAKALTNIQQLPKVWVQMSTAGIYGDPPTQVCTEESTFGYGLAPTVGKAWEKSFLEVLPKGMREVRLRTSFVIGKNGGALKTLKKVAKLGLGGKCGTGKQGMSWIHEYDMNEIILQSIVNQNFSGAYIASSPNPVTNKEFMLRLRRAIKMPIGLPAPVFLVKIGSKFLFKTDYKLGVYGRFVQPARLMAEGFDFKFPNLEEALADLIN